jgi:flagellin
LDAVETAINTALAGAGFDVNAITLDGASVDIGDLVNAGTLTLSGGAEANADETIVTFSIAGGPTQQITVLDTATTVTVNNGAFQGLSFTTDDVKNASGTITIAAVKASEAKFANGEKISDAVTNAGIDVSSREAANEAITIIQKAIETVSAERSKLGAYQNRLEHTINNLGAAAENLTASESRIRDVDMAQEMMEFTKMSILSQAATAMLAQANQQPQLVLQLLG